MKQTANYKFNLPDDSDNIEISELNENFTKTDELIADLESENAAAHSAISDLQSGKADKSKLDGIAYGVCNTAKGTAAKVISCSDFNLYDGARILVTFANGNTSTYMTLNVNNTGAYFAWFPIGTSRAYNNEMISKFIVGGCAYEFVYQDGSTPKWMYCGTTSIPINDETPTYTEAAQRTNLTSGEKLSVAFGKIKKWFSDLKSVAFTGKYTDLSGVPEKFEPKEHTHTKSDITDFPAALKNPSSLTLTVNGSASSYDGSSVVSKAFYAPTASGTVGYELVSSGSGAPVWKPPNYAVCNTAVSTAAKTVSINNFKLVRGARVLIKFTYSHQSILNPATLNVNGTGARPIRYFNYEVRGRFESINKNTSYAVNAYVNTWADGETVEFVYDGTYWASVRDKKTLNPDCVIIGLPVKSLYVGSTSEGKYDYDIDPQMYPNAADCDFLVPVNSSDAADTLNAAINVCRNGGKVILPDDKIYIKSTIKLYENTRLTIEGSHMGGDVGGTTLCFEENGKIEYSSNLGTSYILRLKNLRIKSSTLNTILELEKPDSSSYKGIIILENVYIDFDGDNVGEFYPFIADTVVMKNCKYTVNCNSESKYMCWSGIDCKNLQVEDSTIKLTNNSTNNISSDSFELNFIYNTEVKGYIRNSVLIGSGIYRTNFTNGQVKIEDCDITLGAKASLCHYTTDDERKYSILRDCFISYSNSMYLTFGKVTGCTFKNTTNKNWSTDNGKLQILCPTQMTNNTFIGRSEMNFNENKVLFADNVLQYAQSYTSFPAGSVNANTMISG